MILIEMQHGTTAGNREREWRRRSRGTPMAVCVGGLVMPGCAPTSRLGGYNEQQRSSRARCVVAGRAGGLGGGGGASAARLIAGGKESERLWAESSPRGTSVHIWQPRRPSLSALPPHAHPRRRQRWRRRQRVRHSHLHSVAGGDEELLTELDNAPPIQRSRPKRRRRYAIQIHTDRGQITRRQRLALTLPAWH
jgi:hypothetical protein